MPKKIKMTISLRMEGPNGVVEVDADGTRHGNVRGRSLRRVVWTKGDSIDCFDLKFERLEGVDGALALQPDWPFMDASAKPGNSFDDEAGTVTRVERFAGRLAEEGTYKYTVTAHKGDRSYVLDPVIIIDR